MTSSATFAFAPSNGELVLQAYARVRVRRTAIEAEHMLNARNELNLLFAEWSNRQVNLFNVDQETAALVAGTATYNVAASTVAILDAYIATTSGSQVTDRIILPISRSEYVALPDKTTRGTPTAYWFNRLVSPQVTLWQPPDATIVAASGTLKYYRVTQPEDANLAGGETPGVPYRWIDALTAGLAARLAAIYAQDLEDRRTAQAERAFAIAANQDTEDRTLYLRLSMGGYYR